MFDPSSKSFNTHLIFPRRDTHRRSNLFFNPANILLNEMLSAKLSDFGASMRVPANSEQFTTLVQCTLGYLDPEYLHPSTFSDKTDVYMHR
ncbi:hypothetical protein F2Q69_00051749 [Brassica cretica]|uniref:Protein kinase domain-containing protein n=1 Tax=Brassica cretica TaxID=69181 RepID=A0A8S9PK73_BRACR|nr:hypothetical protein F2Q69_00051749 [Brassica cretica]